MCGYLLFGSAGTPAALPAEAAYDKDKGKVTQGFMRQGKDSGMHSNCNRKGFKSFKQDSHMI